MVYVMSLFLVLILYVVIMLATILTKEGRSGESFYVGDRNSSVFRSSLSIAATWIWAPALFVASEQAYINGTIGLFWFLIPNIACLILFIPFAKKMREINPNGITLSDFSRDDFLAIMVKEEEYSKATHITKF